MKDFFEKYKKAKTTRNLWIIVSSLIIAIWINFFVFDSNIWKSLTADVLGTQNENINGDIFLEKRDNKIILKSNKNMNNIKTFSLSFYYNPENVSITNISSLFKRTNITNIANESWLNTVIINFDTQTTLTKNADILSIETNKKEEKTESLNIWNAYFKDTKWETYLLSPETNFIF